MKEQKSVGQFIRERIFALLIILFEIAMAVAHGTQGAFPKYVTPSGQSDYSDQMLLYTLTAFLAILGYGLLIAYSNTSALTGLVTTLIVVGVSVQLSPLLLQFWHSVFNDFNQSIEVSLITQRVTMALCTSLLASLTSLVGRIGKIQTFIIIFIFNIGWTLAFEATKYVQALKFTQSAPQMFDDYGTNYIYIFAGFFAITNSIVLNIKKSKRQQVGTRHSLYIALIGTGFIFACFPFTGILYPSAAASNIYRRNVGPMNIYFALSASVICTYVSSAIFGKLVIGVKEPLTGILSGGVTIAVVAGAINNIGACIAIGCFSGFVSGFWLQVINPKLNRKHSNDNLGIFGPILTCSIFGAWVLAPILNQIYYSIGSNLLELGGVITNIELLSYQLSTLGISAGVAMISGIISGFLSYLFRTSENDFQLNKLVSNDYGIFRHEEGLEPLEEAPEQAKPYYVPQQQQRKQQIEEPIHAPEPNESENHTHAEAI